MPWPAWNEPLKRFEPGVSRPTNRSSTVLAIVACLSSERRIHAAAVACRCRVRRRCRPARRGEPRCCESNSLREEVRRLERLVPLRREGVEAHAVVDREVVAGLPVVLHVELDVVVAPFRNGELRGLRVGVEDAGGRVRVGIAGVERVAGVVLEVDRAVEAGEDALRLERVLVVEARLERVRAGHLGQVGDHVVGHVLVGERTAVGLVLARVAEPAAAELEVRHVVALRRRPGRTAAAARTPGSTP